jgi:hypothetical protein
MVSIKLRFIHKRSILTIFFLCILCFSTIPFFSVQGVVTIDPIYIRADGSIEQSSPLISTANNITYTLTGNITSTYDGIYIERDNITLVGNGFWMTGSEQLLHFLVAEETSQF